MITLQGKHTLENEHLTTWREEVPQGYSWLVSLSHWSIYYSQNMLCNSPSVHILTPAPRNLSTTPQSLAVDNDFPSGLCANSSLKSVLFHLKCYFICALAATCFWLYLQPLFHFPWCNVLLLMYMSAPLGHRLLDSSYVILHFFTMGHPIRWLLVLDRSVPVCRMNESNGLVFPSDLSAEKPEWSTEAVAFPSLYISSERWEPDETVKLVFFFFLN